MTLIEASKQLYEAQKFIQALKQSLELQARKYVVGLDTVYVLQTASGFESYLIDESQFKARKSRLHKKLENAVYELYDYGVEVI